MYTTEPKHLSPRVGLLVVILSCIHLLLRIDFLHENI